MGGGGAGAGGREEEGGGNNYVLSECSIDYKMIFYFMKIHEELICHPFFHV